MIDLKKSVCLSFIWLLCISSNTYSQSIKNFGDLEVHENGELGIFGPLINNGLFTSESGLVGLYGDKNFDIAGINPPNLYDLEIANSNNVFLNTPITVTNNINFIYGDLQTDKFTDLNYLELISTSFYNGSSNFSKINGFIKAEVENNYMFPIGDENFLRPLSIENNISKATFTACYLSENITNTYSLEKSNDVLALSNLEYWLLKGENEITITLNWDKASEIESLVLRSTDLRIVGFEKASNKWTNLGGVGNTGSLNSGFLSSSSFIPNDYLAITFGRVSDNTTMQPTVSHNGYHYLVSPNGDGVNDKLVIEGLDDFEKNAIKIYDRNGLLVFESDNYIDEFTGSAGPNMLAINRNKGLPQGIYFYIVAVNNGDFTIQGFLYLDR